MGSALPGLEIAAFAAAFVAAGLPFEPAVAERLWRHHVELRRWNPGLSLVGPGAAEELLVRHYGESLAGVGLLPATAGRLLDLGSGAGFPGFVLAAARPDLSVHLIEPNARKATFLRLSAVRAGVVSCRVIERRLEDLGPELGAAAVVTSRALRLTPPMLRLLDSHLPPRATMLLWQGAESLAPEGWSAAAEVKLSDGSQRRIVAYSRGGVS